MINNNDIDLVLDLEREPEMKEQLKGNNLKEVELHVAHLFLARATRIPATFCPCDMLHAVQRVEFCATCHRAGIKQC